MATSLTVLAFFWPVALALLGLGVYAGAQLIRRFSVTSTAVASFLTVCAAMQVAT